MLKKHQDLLLQIDLEDNLKWKNKTALKTKIGHKKHSRGILEKIKHMILQISQ